LLVNLCKSAALPNQNGALSGEVAPEKVGSTNKLTTKKQIQCQHYLHL